MTNNVLCLILEDEMLAQILHDLYVPRELLDGLPEDQKQLLFCKMREEQVRRYNEREEEEDNIIKGRLTKNRWNFNSKFFFVVPTKKKKKQVKFLLGADGNEWCWVMGEPETTYRTNNENIGINQLKLVCVILLRLL